MFSSLATSKCLKSPLWEIPFACDAARDLRMRAARQPSKKSQTEFVKYGSGLDAIKRMYNLPHDRKYSNSKTNFFKNLLIDYNARPVLNQRCLKNVIAKFAKREKEKKINETREIYCCAPEIEVHSFNSFYDEVQNCFESKEKKQIQATMHAKKSRSRSNINNVRLTAKIGPLTDYNRLWPMQAVKINNKYKKEYENRKRSESVDMKNYQLKNGKRYIQKKPTWLKQHDWRNRRESIEMLRKDNVNTLEIKPIVEDRYKRAWPTQPLKILEIPAWRKECEERNKVAISKTKRLQEEEEETKLLRKKIAVDKFLKQYEIYKRRLGQRPDWLKFERRWNSTDYESNSEFDVGDLQTSIRQSRKFKKSNQIEGKQTSVDKEEKQLSKNKKPMKLIKTHKSMNKPYTHDQHNVRSRKNTNKMGELFKHSPTKVKPDDELFQSDKIAKDFVEHRKVVYNEGVRKQPITRKKYSFESDHEFEAEQLKDDKSNIQKNFSKKTKSKMTVHKKDISKGNSDEFDYLTGSKRSPPRISRKSAVDSGDVISLKDIYYEQQHSRTKYRTPQRHLTDISTLSFQDIFESESRASKTLESIIEFQTKENQISETLELVSRPEELLTAKQSSKPTELISDSQPQPQIERPEALRPFHFFRRTSQRQKRISTSSKDITTDKLKNKTSTAALKKSTSTDAMKKSTSTDAMKKSTATALNSAQTVAVTEKIFQQPLNITEPNQLTIDKSKQSVMTNFSNISSPSVSSLRVKPSFTTSVIIRKQKLDDFKSLPLLKKKLRTKYRTTLVKIIMTPPESIFPTPYESPRSSIPIERLVDYDLLKPLEPFILRRYSGLQEIDELKKSRQNIEQTSKISIKLEGTEKSCQCEICHFMNRRKYETDTPLIKELKAKHEKMNLKDYYLSMRKLEVENLKLNICLRCGKLLKDVNHENSECISTSIGLNVIKTVQNELRSLCGNIFGNSCCVKDLDAGGDHASKLKSV